MNPSSTARIGLVARFSAALAGIIAAMALCGYLTQWPSLIHVWKGLQGMSPLTAAALLILACTGFASIHRRERLVMLGAALASCIAAATLISHGVTGGDAASLWVGAKLFHMPAGLTGRSSVATGLGILLIATALVLRRRTPGIADAAATAALLLSGIALLGYLYGVGELYALPMFHSMGLNTAAVLFLLSHAALYAEPTTGWAIIIASQEMGGRAVRRQLAFIALPVIGGWVLLNFDSRAGVGPGIGMALLVIITTVPLTILIIRDGNVLNALERERRARTSIQERQARELARQLAEQAAALAHESEERAKAEASMYRAQRVEAVGQLTGGIAHDFNNLLMAIRGNLELLQSRLPAGESRLQHYLDNATMALDKGAKVTTQLLAFSRSQRLDISANELNPVLSSARALIGNALGPNIELTMALETDGIWVMTDPAQLELAILNLAVNARDAMPKGGQVRIESSRHPGTPAYAAVRVIDNGVGMTPEVAAQAVEPFFTTKEQGKGTGLGLAQVYGFVRQCGGDLQITSKPGIGTQIEMLLQTAAPGIVPALAEDGADSETDDAAGPGQPVLVIDDDDGVRAVIVEALTAFGFDVVEAADGKQGLEQLDAHKPVAAVIDFLMPGMNGAEVARIAQQRIPGLPIVFVSGYSDTLALDGIAGATVLRKPFNIAALNRALNLVLN